MKKLFNLCLGLLLFTSGCTANNVETVPSSKSDENETSINQNDKTLVVYFSATGNTEAVAEIIKEELDADIFVIEPSQSYTNEDLNYNDSNSRVSREHDNVELQNVELSIITPNNWESYSAIFLGYPIWWQNAAWPVTSFVKQNDFSNKTIISFCTSASSSIGSSVDNLKDAAGSGNWLEGKRFSSNVSKDDVINWLTDLSY